MRHTQARWFTSLAAPLAAGALVVSALAAPTQAAPSADAVLGDDLAAPGRVAAGNPATAGARQPRARSRSGGFSAQANGQTPVRREVVLRDPNPAHAAPSDQRRLRDVTVSQNVATGQITAQARFAAAPTAGTESILAVAVGHWDGSSCILDAALMGTAHATEAQGRFGDEDPFTVGRARSGATLTLRSTSAGARLRSLDLECAYASLYSAPDGETVYHSFYAESLEDVYAPKLIIRPGDPVQGNYAGKVTRIRVEVRNDSLTPATGVRLRAAGKSMKIAKPRRNLGRIDARSSKRGIVYNVRLKGKKPRKLVLRAATQGRTFTKRITIARKPAPQRYRSLAGRFFFGFMPARVDKGWDNRAVWFLDNRWAYVGHPKAGKRPKCRKVTKACKRYVYRPRTGKVKIGRAKAVRVTTEGFRFKRASLSEKTLAKKGQRFNVALKRYDFNGNCLIYCNTWTEWLTLRKNGRFVLSRMDIGSIGVPGSGGQWAIVPPDDKGTYRVVSRGRVLLRFANGRKRRHLLAIDHDLRHRPSPQGAGLVLGDRNFYRD